MTLTGRQRDLHKTAESVIERELKALNGLLEHLDDGFIEACELILACRGRIVCIGVGKSGIIARKFAATLASLGTPAHFVHATEAAHGDLGMIAPDDVCVLISHSGKTAETLAVLPALEEVGVHVIAITDYPASPLARSSTATVCPGVEAEADHLGLAPTASTTGTLVLADAISVAVSVARGFGRDDFARRHPGGAIGTALRQREPVRD